MTINKLKNLASGYSDMEIIEISKNGIVLENNDMKIHIELKPKDKPEQDKVFCFRCSNCGSTVEFTDPRKVPNCPHCKPKTFNS